MRRRIDVLYLLALAALVFAIPPTFHGDEAMQIYMSHDFVTAFVERNPSALVTQPPYPVDSSQQLRLINGSVNRYAIGLSWQLAGFTADDLPPQPGWNWQQDYDTNVSLGYVPTPALLQAARFPSTLFLALSVVVMFTLGWQFGGRLAAYLVSALYAVNPIILLNGRRAMQEGSMLFFGLLVILLAALICKRTNPLIPLPLLAQPAVTLRKRGEGGSELLSASTWVRGERPQVARGEGDKPAPLYLWLALSLAGGLTLASKHSGIVFVASALGWIFAAQLTRPRWRDLLVMTAKLVVAGALMVALFVALSPALWSDPPARILDLLAARSELLDIQIESDPLAPTTLAQRIEGIITQPFMTPTQHFEAAFWANFPTVTSDIDRYMASPFSGVQFGGVIGGALTLAAGIGIVVALLRRRARGEIYAGLLVWLLVTAVSLLANPLPWQRYYLPLLPAATLLAGVGLDWIARRFVVKSEQPTVLSHDTS